MRVQLNNPNSIPTIAQIALAGAGSGIVSSYVTGFNNHLERNITQKSWLCRIVTTPTELIKIRQQSLLTQTTTWKIALQIVHENGVAGLYRGLPVTALRDVGYGAYFAAVYKIIFSKHHHTDSVFFLSFLLSTKPPVVICLPLPQLLPIYQT